MTLEEMDRKLKRLRAAAARIGAGLLDVELDPHRRLLDEAQLEGESASRWATTSAALLLLWEWHGLLAALLERAVKVRGTRARLRSDLLTELGELIEGASVECSSRHAPLAPGDLRGSSQATVRLSPDELLERMSGGLDDAQAVLAQVASAWDALAPRLRSARAVVSESSELGQRLGESDPRELDLARHRLTQLTEALARDPLSVRPGQVEALETEVAALRAELAPLAELRDGIGDRLADAHELLEKLRRAQRESEAAHADVLLKIAAPTVPEPVGIVGIETELEQAIELSEAGAWRQARDALAQWTTRASSLLEEARGIAADNCAPIAARNQLRGRLEAYQAKAQRLGLIEDPELSELFERAQGTLYTAPTDLEHAEALLRLYQLALPGGYFARELLR